MRSESLIFGFPVKDWRARGEGGGVEPSTYGLEVRCSILLSYGRPCERLHKANILVFPPSLSPFKTPLPTTDSTFKNLRITKPTVIRFNPLVPSSYLDITPILGLMPLSMPLLTFSNSTSFVHFLLHVSPHTWFGDRCSAVRAADLRLPLP